MFGDIINIEIINSDIFRRQRNRHFRIMGASGSTVSAAIKATPDESLHDLKCIICGQLLTCPPIIMHEQGNSCGRCKTTESKQNKAFEALARLQKLPCRYSECYAELDFYNVLSHEQFCTYRQYKCLVLSNTCSWIGRRCNLKAHYKEMHTEFVCNRTTSFSLNLKADFEQNLFVNELYLPFVLYIKYEKKLKNMKCVLFQLEKPNDNVNYNYKISLRAVSADPSSSSIKKQFLFTCEKCLVADTFDFSESDLVDLGLNKLEYLIEKCQSVDVNVEVNLIT